MANYTAAERTAFDNKAAALDASVAGGCPAVRFAKAVTSCALAQGAAACKQLAGSCVYSQGVCQAALYGNDEWGKAVAQAAATCRAASKNSGACAKTPVGAVIQQSRVSALVNFA